MNLQDAYNILGVSSTSSKDEAKQAFRTLAKQYHPDRNPNDPTAEAKFKEINAAYEYIQNPPQQNPFNFGGAVNVSDFADLFINFQHFSNKSAKQKVKRQTPNVTLNLTFKESILGCEKTITYDRYLKCEDCGGAGQILSVTNCKICNGQGYKRSNFSRGNVSFNNHCHTCGGSGRESTKCSKCDCSGDILSEQSSFKVQLPVGLVNDQIIRLSGGGNFVQATNMGDMFSEAYIKVKVESDPDIRLDGENVISDVNISLLEALKGTVKSVRTVNGEMDLKIESGAKHKDILNIPKCGLGGIKDHLFVVNVKYPEKIGELVEFLEK